MITRSSVILAMRAVGFVRTRRPIKKTIALLIFSAWTFLVLGANKTPTWIPTIYIIIIVGGILIIFIILAALSPNEKRQPVSGVILAPTLMWVLTRGATRGQKTSSEATLLEALSISHNFYIITFLILAYFLCFTGIIYSIKNSMRKFI